MLPLAEISKASLPRVNLQQSQRPAPHPVQSSTLQLPHGASSSHCTPTVAGHCWKRPVYHYCCSTNAPKGKEILSMSLRCLKGDRIMQYRLKMKQYLTPLNTTLFPNTAYAIIPKTGVPPVLIPSTWKLPSKQGLHKLDRQILYHSHFCSVDW